MGNCNACCGPNDLNEIKTGWEDIGVENSNVTENF